MQSSTAQPRAKGMPVTGEFEGGRIP